MVSYLKIIKNLIEVYGVVYTDTINISQDLFKHILENEINSHNLHSKEIQSFLKVNVIEQYNNLFGGMIVEFIDQDGLINMHRISQDAAYDITVEYCELYVKYTSQVPTGKSAERRTIEIMKYLMARWDNMMQQGFTYREMKGHDILKARDFFLK